MIVRFSTAAARLAHIGQSGDSVAVAPDENGVYFHGVPLSETFPPSALPLARRRCARVAMLAGERCFAGFSWHAACLPLTPANWRHVLDTAAPDYLLIESCVYDSQRAWPLLPQAVAADAGLLRRMAEYAARKDIPAVFWHTLGPDMLPCFAEALPDFAIVACADGASLEELRRRGLSPRPLPQAFAPEYFNPMSGPRFEAPASRIVFDGIGRLTRFAEVRDAVAPFLGNDLAIVDSGALTPPYNLARSPARIFSGAVLGTISRTLLPDLYKDSVACLSVATPREGYAPAWEQRALEAAACRLPVLHVGPLTGPMAEIASTFESGAEAAEFWQHLRREPLALARAAHAAWRKSHREHTFAHRMATIHRWLGVGADPLPDARASIITPSMRPDNFPHVLAQYEAQSWADKELVYVFNGPKSEMPRCHRPDVRMLHVPPEHAAGMAMNAGLVRASGDCVFRLDDDDLYGAHYVADRMLYFREFTIDSLTNARIWTTFDGTRARLSRPYRVPQDDTVIALGCATYAVGRYTGASWAARREFALRLGFLEAANAHADAAFLLKAMSLAPASPHLRISPFNLCVRRGEPAGHTWGVSRAELETQLSPGAVPLDEVFL